jgi:RHS repeat-associated protein
VAQSPDRATSADRRSPGRGPDGPGWRRAKLCDSRRASQHAIHGQDSPSGSSMPVRVRIGRATPGRFRTRCSGRMTPTFRHYDPTSGRWLSPDPAGSAAVDLTNPQSLNRYAYVGNNPTTLTDPSGLCPNCPPPCSNLAYGQGGGMCQSEVNSVISAQQSLGPTSWDAYDLLNVGVFAPGQVWFPVGSPGSPSGDAIGLTLWFDDDIVQASSADRFSRSAASRPASEGSRGPIKQVRATLAFVRPACWPERR